MSLFLLCFLLTVSAVDSTNNSEIALDFPPFLRIYKDGRVQRFLGTKTLPAGFDSATGVESKDVLISPETGVSARLYLPKTAGKNNRKLPLLVYFHGGAFIIESASSPTYHNYLNILAGNAEIAVVSVDYRLAPEHPIPAAYDDSWSALKWVAAHSGGNGPEQWLNARADFRRVFLAGDSAGANIVNRMGIREGLEGLGGGIKLRGVVLVHPYFMGEVPIAGEPTERLDGLARAWRFADPTTIGLDDPWMNPDKDPTLKYMGCKKVMVCVAGIDILKYRGLRYYETLAKSGWVGSLEKMESEGEDHVFHLKNLKSENAMALLRRVSSFLNES